MVTQAAREGRGEHISSSSLVTKPLVDEILKDKLQSGARLSTSSIGEEKLTQESEESVSATTLRRKMEVS